MPSPATNSGKRDNHSRGIVADFRKRLEASKVANWGFWAREKTNSGGPDRDFDGRRGVRVVS
jgi:hypothetical protein